MSASAAAIATSLLAAGSRSPHELSPNIKVTVIGDAFVDIVATHVNELPTWGHNSLSERLDIFTGGSAGNVVAHLAAFSHKQPLQIDLNKKTSSNTSSKKPATTAAAPSSALPAPLFPAPAYICHIGNDSLGNYTLRHQQARGVDTSFVLKDPVASTGGCLVLSSHAAGDRSFVSSLGANATFTPGHLARHAGVMARLAASSHVHVSNLLGLPLISSTDKDNAQISSNSSNANASGKSGSGKASPKSKSKDKNNSTSTSTAAAVSSDSTSLADVLTAVRARAPGVTLSVDPQNANGAPWVSPAVAAVLALCDVLLPNEVEAAHMAAYALAAGFVAVSQTTTATETGSGATVPTVTRLDFDAIVAANSNSNASHAVVNTNSYTYARVVPAPVTLSAEATAAASAAASASASLPDSVVVGVLTALLPAHALLVLKEGPRGARAFARGRCIASCPVFPATVVDTTGGGDSFDAAFLAAWLSGHGAAAAVRAGCATGAIRVGVVSGSSHCPTWAQVMDKTAEKPVAAL